MAGISALPECGVLTADETWWQVAVARGGHRASRGFGSGERGGRRAARGHTCRLTADCPAVQEGQSSGQQLVGWWGACRRFPRYLATIELSDKLLAAQSDGSTASR